MNTLQLYIIIITYPCIYLYIYNNLCWGLNFFFFFEKQGLNNWIGLFICYFIGSILKVFILVWYGIFLAHQLGTNTGNGIRFHNGCPIYCMSHLWYVYINKRKIIIYYQSIINEWWVPLIKFMVGPTIHVRGRSTHLWYSGSTHLWYSGST